MNTEKRTSPFHNGWSSISGTHEYALVLVMVFVTFFLLLAVSSYGILKILELGDYAMLQIGRNFSAIALCWLLLTLVVAVISVKVSSFFSQRVIGPVKRMERLLDRMLANEDVTIVVREKDALAAIAGKINQVVERQKKRNVQ